MRLRLDAMARGFWVIVIEKLTLKLVAQFADAYEVPGDLDTTIRVHDNRKRIEHGNHPSGLHADAGESVPDAVRQSARQPLAALHPRRHDGRRDRSKAWLRLRQVPPQRESHHQYRASGQKTG